MCILYICIYMRTFFIYFWNEQTTNEIFLSNKNVRIYIYNRNYSLCSLKWKSREQLFSTKKLRTNLQSINVTGRYKWLSVWEQAKRATEISYKILKIFSFKKALITNGIHKDLRYCPFLFSQLLARSASRNRIAGGKTLNRLILDRANQKCNDRRDETDSRVLSDVLLIT